MHYGLCWKVSLAPQLSCYWRRLPVRELLLVPASKKSHKSLEMLIETHVLGVCLDTCHIFAAGYDFSGYNGYERVLREFDEVLGVGKIRAIHLNDSKTGLGSRVDRHAPIGLGTMGVQVFHALVSDSRFNEVPKILEIVATAPELIPSQLKLLREYASSPSRLQEPKKQGSQTRMDEAIFSSSG